MKILFAASEVAPYVKSGGLGDVMGSLPLALSKNRDVEVSLFLPYYKSIKENFDIKTEFVASFYVSLAWRNEYAGVFRLAAKSKKLKIYFIDNEYYFKRDSLYGDYDDGERFAFFSKAVLESLQYLKDYPDIIHCNDWQTSLIPVFLKTQYQEIEEYKRIKTVFTIHNIEYQGKVPKEFGTNVMGLNPSQFGIVFHCDCINLMKGAIVTADKITTVSKTYSHEIKHAYFSHGLDNILREYEYKLCGIANGIDTAGYNPKDDPHLFANYSHSDLSNKAENKQKLQELLGLEIRSEVPVIAMITRLVAHKGVELVEYVAHDMLKTDLQLIVVGEGDKKYEELFNFLAYCYPGRVSANITFDPDLASKVYAGADMLLMPSKSEPCGLSQLIAMRYGTVPIVRETGGLYDTVPALNIETMEGKGFTFKLFNAHDMVGAVHRAIEFFHDKEKWTKHV